MQMHKSNHVCVVYPLALIHKPAKGRSVIFLTSVHMQTYEKTLYPYRQTPINQLVQE